MAVRQPQKMIVAATFANLFARVRFEFNYYRKFLQYIIYVKIKGIKGIIYCIYINSRICTSLRIDEGSTRKAE